ncbi:MULTISPECIES: bifunctional 4-hydroxy-3-methylbut-2-enyl diphosphate reductase/30S ribosomal protein S1 [unclassified Sedimentibacter]|uniref:bifunctional 4-hydroxy-3-methylbut-2-enyl diphosphate reductase/30S ribosomal protein S1 n=1 Tax=unclassified Sedimentibacter TaxID=2649220 RepID=UPI0027DFCBDD|nr:bifunctional 4-hydroxy-3-methylbut-2-enyl diphosphate reductase/30S ribosomal protein S1 [Sedimentibacter sp. MB35-C1]WMJ76211.1 bifunctional 4-hydroxy-3-methylbut-2-enyl diphosphate reductase/30S ribosomal protein S1 [Sedimentibacter sp. MB35-C1]
MKIEISKFNGFCSGVKIAVDKADKILDNEKKLYSYGEIIHNKYVVDKLKSKGLVVVDDIPPSTDAKLLIRAHGVGKDIFDKMEENSLEVIDATCVKVKKIHKIVEEYKNNGYDIIITGDKNHPEVLGILGWCKNEAYVIDKPEQLLNINISPDKKYCLVSQTTFNTDTFRKISDKIIENNFSNIEIHNTICNATSKRQEACVELASRCNVMLIIGGKNSSNTKKLYELSKEVCHKTFLIENYKDIPYNYIDKNTIVGVSAGASAPDWIIEEVINMLENLNNNMNEQVEKKEQAEQTEQGTMHDLLENYGGLSYIRTGEIVKGTVIYVSPDSISLNIKYKSDGIITKDEFSLAEVQDLTQVVKEGDEIEAQVLKISDQDGNVVLTRRPLEERKIWEELEEMRSEGTEIETTIIEASQYGIYGKVKGIKGFIPRNQISVTRNVDTSGYVGKVLKVQILETKNKKGRRQLVLTSRAVEKREKDAREAEAWETIKEGEIYEGTVKNLQDYGAFVEINGIDGLLHINEIAWTRIKHPSDVLKTGDKISVKVKNVDKENKRMSLSYKATIKSPWAIFLDKHQKGDVVTGKVTRIVDFGAFVEVDGIECLLHIKDLDWARTEKVTDVLQEGQEVTAKILNITRKDRKVGLGLKQLVEHPFDKYAKDLKKDDIIPVEVTRILLDGIHVSANGNIDCFIPIAKVSNEKLRTPAQVVKVGEVKDAKVLGVDMKGKNLNLTLILENKSDDFATEDASYKQEEANFTIGESIGSALEDLLK